MTDARLSTSFPTHPKTKKLLRRMGPAGPWSLVCLFLWARMNRPDGDLSGMTDEDIELACDWTGDDGALVAALVSVGFMDGAAGARKIHDWTEHQPWSAGSEDRKQSSAFAALCKRYGREEAARRMPEYAGRTRAASSPRAEAVRTACDSHAAGMPSGRGPDAPLPSPLPLPSPSPLPLQKADEQSARDPDTEPTPAGLACAAMREAGLPGVLLNPQHPDLLAAIAAGATPAEFGATAAELIAKRGGNIPAMAYVVATVANRRTEASAKAANVTPLPVQHRQEPEKASHRPLGSPRRG